jgi:membrane protease YdiL (CAAX protease family)
LNKELKKKIIIYTSFAYVISWSIAFALLYQLKTYGLNNFQLNLYHSFAAIGPALAAFITSYLFYGKNGVYALTEKIKFPSLSLKTKQIILSPILFFAVGFILYAIVKKDWFSFKHYALINWSSIGSFYIWFLPLLTYSIFEEIGWRGFLLPHLQEKYNALKATIILTIIWVLWHIPFFFYRFNFSLGISIGFFFGIFVGAIILTFIYNSGRGNLIPVMLFHFLNNLCSEFEKEIIVAVLSSGFIFIAIFVYKKFGKENLSETPRTKNYFLAKS